MTIYWSSRYSRTGKTAVILVNDPAYYDGVMDHPWFIPACFLVGILLAANLFVMRTLTNIKV